MYIRLKFHRAFRFPLHASRCYVPLTAIMLTTDAISVTFFYTLYLYSSILLSSRIDKKWTSTLSQFTILHAWGGKTVWHMFEQNTSNHFQFTWEEWRGKREAQWNFSLRLKIHSESKITRALPWWDYGTQIC